MPLAAESVVDVRLIQATVPAEAESAVTGVLEERGIGYFGTDETGTDEYETVYYVSIPEQQVEPVLADLHDAGLDDDDHIVIIDAEVDIFGQTDPEVDNAGEHERIAAAELQGKTEGLLSDLRTFVTMMVLSTLVATTGVLLDSAAVVVGAMVLAPLFGPAASTSVGTVIDDSTLFRRGVQYQTIGVGVAIVSAALFAWVMKSAYLTPSGFAVTSAPQIVDRLSPDLLSLVVALVAGTAGIISIATDAGRALVGVMMAAALLPPAAIVGIGLAWNEPGVAINSGVLLAVNVLAINFAGLVTLWYLGYRPQSWIKIPGTRRALLKRAGALFVAILLVSVVLWNVTSASVQQSQVENTLEDDIKTLLETDAAAYENVTLLDVTVEQDRTSITHEIERVVVTVGRPPGDHRPTLHREIDSRVEEQVGENVSTNVRVTLVVNS